MNGLLEWVENSKEPKTHELSDASFEHDTQASSGATTGDWFVIFYKTQCLTKLAIEPAWESAANKYI